MQQGSSRKSRTPIKPHDHLLYKSPTPSKSAQINQAFTSSKPRAVVTPTPQRPLRPKSVNYSFDFSLDTSKMFTAGVEKSKFYPEAIPSPTFDIHACREEINRISLQLTNGTLLEHKIMRND